jgi:hypothetical protein
MVDVKGTHHDMFQGFTFKLRQISLRAARYFLLPTEMKERMELFSQEQPVIKRLGKQVLLLLVLTVLISPFFPL